MEIEQLKRAFPSSLDGQVDYLLRQINLRSQPQPGGAFSVWVADEKLKIPYRIYFPENILEIEIGFSPIQNVFLCCLYSRHHNGFIREKCLREIILVEHEWIPPYVVRLLGEYVIEILDVIHENLPNIKPDF